MGHRYLPPNIIWKCGILTSIQVIIIIIVLIINEEPTNRYVVTANMPQAPTEHIVRSSVAR